ncbi:MAG: Lrp/AsnC family transcriptional regulator [Gaiella sp.]
MDTPLDRIDSGIVALLQKNARRSNKELAESLGIAPSTCLERLRRLLSRGVIRGFHADVDPAALGRMVQAMIGVRLSVHDRELIDRFREHALALPETLAFYHVAGADDYLVHVSTLDTDHLRDLVVSGFTTRPEVAHVETRLIFEYRRQPAPTPLLAKETT